MKKMKRLTACVLALALLLGLAGCGTQEQGQSQQSTAAKGRYVEQEMELPVGGYAMDMVQLSDGRIRVAVYAEDGTVLLHTTNAACTDWEESQPLPEEIGKSGSINHKLALSANGEVFCTTYQENPENKTYTHHLWMVDADGKARELPITYPDVNPEEVTLVSDCDFTESGRLMAVFSFQDLREVNIQTGELGENMNDQGLFVWGFDTAGENTYLLGNRQAAVVGENGFSDLPKVLDTQFMESMKATEGIGPKIVVWENGDGYVFFTTHDGLYSCLPEGSVTEMLVDGARTSLGDPTFFPVAVTGKEDHSFYVMGNISGTGVLYRYVYDPDMPTQPSTQLRLYTLYEDENLRQMVSQYQKSHPDVAIDLEVGLSGEDGTTEADAIRTLNTQILAGDGPDIIRLDGMNLDTYLEKGLLADLSAALDEPLLDQVARCYEQDGKIFALPTAFILPAVYGPGHIVSQIRDLDSLVAVLQQAKQENTMTKTVINGVLPVMIADCFYDSCSAAWIREDGTLDEEMLTQFYRAMQQVYGLDEDYRQANAEMLSEWRNEEANYTPGDYTGLSGAMMVLMGVQCVTAGTLEGVEAWSWALAGDDQLEGFETAPISLQSSGVFLPRRVMGVLNTSANQPAALDFIGYMVGKEAQSVGSIGFPVNQAAFDQQIAEDKVSDMSIGTSDMDGNYLEVSGQWPDARRRQELKTWVDDLTTPALTNRIIRSMVIDQAADCMEGKTTPEEAAKAAIKALNLYLSE